MFTVDRAVDIDSRLNIVGEILERRGSSNDASTYSNGNLSSKLVSTLLVSSLWNRNAGFAGP